MGGAAWPGAVPGGAAVSPGELRAMARRLEATVMLLEAGDPDQRQIAEEIKREVARLRRWAASGGAAGRKAH